jgi:lycopene beta-cyclase
VEAVKGTAYDYIIAGAGAAGLSLALRLSHPDFSNRRILLIDRSAKTENDRTWCYWEDGDGLFDSVCKRQWSQLDFFGPNTARQLDLSGYRYKMLRGPDFYRFALDQISACSHIEWCQAEIYHTGHGETGAEVHTSAGSFSARWVFSSLLENDVLKSAQQGHFLWQHFLGWEIQTDQAVFNPNCPVFMDFRTPQRDGTCFVYVLPYSSNYALVEYTVFSAEVWPTYAYEDGLRSYLKSHLQLGSWQVGHVEEGKIPMSSAVFPVRRGHVVFLGTAGGQTKGSTGYTFSNIQRHSDAIAALLRQARPPIVTPDFRRQRYHLYDNTLLSVLCLGDYSGAELFERLFTRNPARRMLRFLDEAAHFGEELQVMNSVPRRLFARRFMQEWFSRRD